MLLVDDHQMLIEALAARLSTVPDMCVAGQSPAEGVLGRGPSGDNAGPRPREGSFGRPCPGAGAEPVELAAQLPPDVITVELPSDSDVVDVFARLRASWPQAQVVVLTGSRDPQEAVEAARAGANGWVRKESSVDTLAEVLRGVCRGDAYFPPEQLGHVLRDLQADVGRPERRTGPLDSLTSRERGVLLGWIEGRSSAEIADALDVSVHTVRTHANNVLAKLGVHHRLQAVRAARAAGMRPGVPVSEGSIPLGSPR